jgi:hypothetical protein
MLILHSCPARSNSASQQQGPASLPDRIGFTKSNDGYRLRVERNGDRVRLITKGGYDWTKRFPWIAEAAPALPVTSVVA